MAVDWTQVLVAGIAGAPAIWAAWTASKASRKVDDVGKQVGQHVYDAKDRANTEALRAEIIQRQVESLVQRPVQAPQQPIGETTVSGYVRKAQKAAESAQEAAEKTAAAVEELKTMVLGHTPVVKLEVEEPLKGPAPPPISPLR